jgi:hypothetical protein
MADSGTQSPLGINVLGSVLNNTGLTINPVAAGYMGASKTNTDYTFGSLVSSTALRLLTWAINDGYNRGPGNSNATLSNTTYNNLISIGSTTVPTLGNSPPSTYVISDPANVWTGQATSGYGISGNTDQGQAATWLPYSTDNTNMSVTQWGYTRLHALQAWNEFNWNGTSTTQSVPDYKEFCSSVLTVNGLMTAANKITISANNANTFLDGTYSNMNDLISADVAGISLSTVTFGNDLVNLGNALDLTTIESFGLPSNLLVTLGKNLAVTQDLSLALLASGLSTTDVSNITNGLAPNVTAIQQQQIYGAFLIITGENLQNVLAPLQCNTQGLTTLADLLNVQKLFPTSYASLTVPVYNGAPGPTNSKTYYLIYSNGGVNSALSNPVIKSYVGSQIPNGTPQIFDKAVDPSNYTPPPIGFGSYLVNILPADQAVAAGAFSYTMRQVRNIKNCNFAKFAKVVQGIENTSDLPLVGGTSKPTDQTLNDIAISKTSVGSGPQGTYTMSDFFGCMSGLPYPWQLIQERVTQVQTTKLYNIYQQLLLAVEWEQATATVQYTTNVIGGTPYYTTTGVTVNDLGGGYGRGGAPAPTITISDGSTATCTIDTDDTNAGSNGTGIFGRIKTITFGAAGAASTTIPTAQIQAPPTDVLPVNTNGTVATGGTNTAYGTSGWASTMNTVVQDYINQANTEIASIQQNNPTIINYLQNYWNTCGTQLTIEQRARYVNIIPVPAPKNNFLNLYPSSLSIFVDSVPTMAQDTGPHMSAQTLEAVSNLNTTGGQSIVAMMRQERNQTRLQSAGIDLDNNILNVPSPSDIKTLTTNGTISGAATGIVSPNGNTYTNPAWPANIQNGVTISPAPLGLYEPTTGFQPTNNTTPGDITQILNGTQNPLVNPTIPVGPSANVAPTNSVVIIAPPADQNPNSLPPNLDPNFINSALLPASPSINSAIHHVTTCNCDCWVA